MTEKFTNFARTTIVGAIDDVVTSLVVEYATNFPTSGDFRLRCQNEIMLCTAVAGTTFTVTRGVEGTTAAAHGAGTPIAHVLTAGGLAAILSAISGYWQSVNSSSMTGDVLDLVDGESLYSIYEDM
jgi:hypothetical protein